MKTRVIMERELFGMTITQDSKTEFFSATDLVRAGNKWRNANELADFNVSAYLKQKGTLEFIDELTTKYGNPLKITRGRYASTWVHPLLFIDIALAISPKLKIEVYNWLFDSLIKYRNDSGDSYRAMSAALYSRYGNKRDFLNYIQKVAAFIRDACGVKTWEKATEQQLQQRDNMHKAIVLFSRVLTNPNQIVRLAVKEYSPQLKNIES